MNPKMSGKNGRHCVENSEIPAVQSQIWSSHETERSMGALWSGSVCAWRVRMCSQLAQVLLSAGVLSEERFRCRLEAFVNPWAL